MLGGVPALRALLEEAKAIRDLGQGTLLLVDEIHRFNKAQQDALLPHVEVGAITLVGATTENPSFSCNAALLSRCRVLPLQSLSDQAADQLLARIQQHPNGINDLSIHDDAWQAVRRLAAGDGRRLCLLLESAWQLQSQLEGTGDDSDKSDKNEVSIQLKTIEAVVQQSIPSHDRAGEAHYDVASAFIKSMRASDPQAAIFYLARQLEAGEDPMFVARRIVIFACEDVGLADPQALVIAQSALSAVQSIGMPEAIYPLTEATLYNATAPKSNTTKSYFAAAKAVKQWSAAAVPMFLRNAPTTLMKDMGYGQGYQYDHDAPGHFAGQSCLPDEIRRQVFYQPGSFGFEKEIAKRMEWWDSKRQ